MDFEAYQNEVREILLKEMKITDEVVDKAFDLGMEKFLKRFEEGTSAVNMAKEFGMFILIQGLGGSNKK